MILWINGPFGAGKSTLAELLVQTVKDAVIFDPEYIGFLIHKTVPESRSQDFQNFPMWREHVILFAKNLSQQFGKTLIIPMTLVQPEYLAEIHNGLKKFESRFFHFFLNLDEATLRERIEKQVVDLKNPEADNEIRQWRLAQVKRCLSAVDHLPQGTTVLDSGRNPPEELVQRILAAIQ